MYLCLFNRGLRNFASDDETDMVLQKIEYFSWNKFHSGALINWKIIGKTQYISYPIFKIFQVNFLDLLRETISSW